MIEIMKLLFAELSARKKSEKVMCQDHAETEENNL